jgi:ornithine cyclodeaminase/alanine dehydrogenase-like protein (mu-crystallin family)
MPIEAALIKPVVDALMGLFRQGEHIKLKHNAEAALREAIRELLLADPNESRAEARIAIAKAAGIISEDVALAEDMLKKHRATASRTRGKVGSSRARKAVDKPAPSATKATRGKPPVRKPSPKSR